MIGALAVTWLPIDATDALRSFHLPPQRSAALEAWARFDACWYVGIAHHGYTHPIGPFLDLRPAFFPLFPALVAIVIPVFQNPLVAGLVVANGCLFVFLVCLWRLIELDWDVSVAARAVWIYLLFPSSFFLSSAYSEPLLLATSAGALLAARREQWCASGLLAAAAALTRPVGIGVVLAVLFERATFRCEGVRWSLGAVITMVLPTTLAITAYLIFAAHTFGDPFALFSVQAVYRGALAPPWRPFVELFVGTPQLHGFNNSLFDAMLAVVAVLSIPLTWSRVRPSYAVYALVVVITPLSGSLLSFNRLLLPSFPHAILLAQVTEMRQRALAMFLGFAMLLFVLMARFATWRWVA
jgi:hypothetical protein